MFKRKANISEHIWLNIIINEIVIYYTYKHKLAPRHIISNRAIV